LLGPVRIISRGAIAERSFANPSVMVQRVLESWVTEQIVASFLFTRELTTLKTRGEGSVDDNNKMLGVIVIGCSMVVPLVIASSVVIGNGNVVGVYWAAVASLLAGLLV